MAGTPVTVVATARPLTDAITSRCLDHLTNAQAVTMLEGVDLPPLED